VDGVGDGVSSQSGGGGWSKLSAVCLGVGDVESVEACCPGFVRGVGVEGDIGVGWLGDVPEAVFGD
jgi:hypothetical protein